MYGDGDHITVPPVSRYSGRGRFKPAFVPPASVRVPGEETHAVASGVMQFRGKPKPSDRSARRVAAFSPRDRRRSGEPWNSPARDGGSRRTAAGILVGATLHRLHPPNRHGSPERIPGTRRDTTRGSRGGPETRVDLKRNRFLNAFGRGSEGGKYRYNNGLSVYVTCVSRSRRARSGGCWRRASRLPGRPGFPCLMRSSRVGQGGGARHLRWATACGGGPRASWIGSGGA